MGILPQGRIQEQVIIGDEIQVDGPGGIFITAAHPPQLLFQRQENMFFKGSCLEGGPDQQGGVEKIRIVGPDRRGFPDRGTQHHLNQILEARRGQRQMMLGLDIRTKQQAHQVLPSSHSVPCLPRSISTPTDRAKRTAPGFSTRTRTFSMRGSSRQRSAKSAARASTVSRWAVSACVSTLFDTER